MKKNSVTPGIHPDFNFKNFSEKEQNIIKNSFAQDFYVTNSGKIIILGGTSEYHYFLIKFTDSFQEQFNIEREIAVLFSAYDTFQPRTLDAFDEIFKNHQELRIDKICSFLISSDKEIEDRIKRVLNNANESQIIVPFTYEELLYGTPDSFFFKNRIKKYFYARDLFSFESALKKDIYFFGRTEIVHNIINRHRNSENSGLFGLRKSGKTSIIFAVQRTLQQVGEYSVYIDCQDTGFYLKRWNAALYEIVVRIISQNRIKGLQPDISEYREDNVSTAFLNDLTRINKKIHKPILIIFDEIERICFKTSSENHWKSGIDFIKFWRTLRSVFQQTDKLYTYFIVSTNPMCIECPTIDNDDNPIFSQIPIEYIPPFNVSQTKEMVQRLAKVMGLDFDDVIFSKLNEDFGGHPFLIRMVCSAINSIVPSDRPQRIDKTIYERGKKKFEENYNTYIDMVLSVLKNYYADEYDMLTYLAIGDMEFFNSFAMDDSLYTKHLLGYNIVDKNNNSYFFKIEIIKNYLVQKNLYKKISLTNDEKLEEISERRNHAEPKLRNLVRRTLLTVFGESSAKEKILNITGKKKSDAYINFSLQDLFNANKAEIYFSDLGKIILKDWDVFKNIFGDDKTAFQMMMENINRLRADAHAKTVSDDEMAAFRVSMDTLEKYLKIYDGI